MSFSIKVYDRRKSYEFSIDRKVTILKGDSATGKTTLVKLINSANNGNANIVCSKKCIALNCSVNSGIDYEIEQIRTHENTLIVIDENSKILRNSVILSRVINESSNYYLIITREKLYSLKVSMGGIKKIETVGTRNTLVPLYSSYGSIESDIKIDKIISEDEMSGKKFFEKYINKNCESSHGISNMTNIIDKEVTNGSILVIYDADKAGFYEEDIEESIAKNKKCKWYRFHPDSFEGYILRSPMIGIDTKDAIGDNVNNIEEELERLLRATLPIEYNKSSSSVCIMMECAAVHSTKCANCKYGVATGMKREKLVYNGLEHIK